MIKTLTAGLSKEDAKYLSDNFKNCSTTRERLTELLTKKIEGSVSKARSEQSYESPVWAYKQADNLGYQRAMQEVIELLKD